MRPQFESGRLTPLEYIAALEREVIRLHCVHRDDVEHITHLGWELVGIEREREAIQRAHDGLLAIVDGLLKTFGAELEEPPGLHLIEGGGEDR